MYCWLKRTRVYVEWHHAPGTSHTLEGSSLPQSKALWDIYKREPDEKTEDVRWASRWGQKHDLAARHSGSAAGQRQTVSAGCQHLLQRRHHLPGAQGSALPSTSEPAAELQTRTWVGPQWQRTWLGHCRHSHSVGTGEWGVERVYSCASDIAEARRETLVVVWVGGVVHRW